MVREPQETPGTLGAREPTGIPEARDTQGGRNLRNSHDARNPAVQVGQTVVVVKRSEHRLYLYKDGELVRTYRVGVGKRRGSTPRGQFWIVGKARNPAWSYKGKYVPGGSPANPLGHWWMALSVKARSGSRIGIHGTNAPWSIGGNVSRGCIRMYNRDAASLFRQVSAGTPVVID